MLDNSRNSRALVVGGAGFVGSNLIRVLIEAGCGSVVVVDNLLSSERDNLPEDSRVELRVGSIADDRVLQALSDDFDYVFHLATYHGNESSIANPLDDHENNLITTLKLFERLKSFRRVRRIVYASTGCALAAKGKEREGPVAEDGLVSLDYDSPYQISKIVGEMYALYYHRHHGLPIARTRFQNVYGPGEVLGAGEWRGTPATIWRNVIPSFVYRAIKNQPLPLYGEGTSTRDFIYVDDVVDGLLRCALTEGAEGDVFNLASGIEVTIRDLAQRINRLTGNTAGLKCLPQRPWDRALHRSGNTAKAAGQLGFEVRVELLDGLQRTIEWTRKNLTRIQACIKRHYAWCRVEF